jgi:glycine dehydrogenase
MLYKDEFRSRHTGAELSSIDAMLRVVGASSVDALIDETVPPSIRLTRPLALPRPATETEMLAEAQMLAERNVVARSFIGMGYYGTITPPTIQRNILENPGWYTQNTPYQAEIAQGRLESLLNFQTMVIDLTRLEIANASLLDEATAAAEAMHMMHAALPAARKDAHVLLVSNNVFPQTLAVLQTRAEPLGIEIRQLDWQEFEFTDDVMGCYVQYPAGDGSVSDYEELCSRAHAAGCLVTVGTDLLALTMLEPPGEFGAHIAVGSAQRFGVPMGYGGPHAAFIATREVYKRLMPGRIIGVSVDAQGHVAYRMALQTREQHIRRDKATSNICTAQALLANMAAMYAVYHGPTGLRGIAERVHTYASALADGVKGLGYTVANDTWFDTLCVQAPAHDIHPLAEAAQMNFRYYADGERIGISIDETTTAADIAEILGIFSHAKGNGVQTPDLQHLISRATGGIPMTLHRNSPFLQHPVFNSYHTEHELLRYMKRLENKDLSLVHSMIPLGSCTMKLNAAAEMMPVTMRGFSAMHPFAPREQAAGYLEVFRQLEAWLSEITGFDACSLQPNAGAQASMPGCSPSGSSTSQTVRRIATWCSSLQARTAPTRPVL